MVINFLNLTRPLSNLKNIAIFLLAFYLSGSEFHLNLVVLGILSISLICSASYSYNSYTDCLIDQKNTNKMHYSDAVNGFGHVNITYIIMPMLLAGVLLAYFINLSFLFIILTLFLTNYLYSSPLTRFKEKPLLDILFGAFLTYPLRFLAGWYIFTNEFPPILVLVSLALAKSGGYIMYKALDREYLLALDIKNSITLIPKERLISISSIFIGLSVISYIFLCLNSEYFRIHLLGGLPLSFLLFLPFVVPPLFIAHRQIYYPNKINNRLLRRISFAYFAFVIFVVWVAMSSI